MNLKIEHKPVDQLVPYVRNARTHSDEQVSQIAGSIAEFGFVNPILVGDDNVIIAGHGRLMAAHKIGLYFYQTWEKRARKNPWDATPG